MDEYTVGHGARPRERDKGGLDVNCVFIHDEQMTDVELIRFVDELGGVAPPAPLMAAFDRRRFEAAVANGDLRKVAHGRYATYDVDGTRDAAVAVTGVITGLSAAQWWAWETKRPPSKPVVTVPRNRAARRAGVTVLRRDLPETAVVDGIVLAKAHTVIDCARTLPFDEALAVADSALRDPEVTRKDLEQAAASWPRSGRLVTERVIGNADARAANPFESCVRATALGVPGLRLEPQVQIGTIGWVDLADQELRIVVECESWAYHNGVDLFRRDVRRYTDMVRRGWLVVRFVWEDVAGSPDRIRAVLSEVVALRRTG